MGSALVVHAVLMIYCRELEPWNVLFGAAFGIFVGLMAGLVLGVVYAVTATVCGRRASRP